MSYRHDVEKLKQNLKEISKQYRLGRLRRLLKFLLVGFLIGRDSEKKISELTARNELIMKDLFKRFEDLDYSENRIKEFADALFQLTQIEENLENIVNCL